MVRRNNEDEMKGSAPCKSCTEMLKLCNVKFLIYSTDNKKLKKVKVKDFTTDHVSLGNRNIYKYYPNVLKRHD